MADRIKQERARLAALSRHHKDDLTGPALLAVRRDLAAAKLEQYVARVVAEAPPLSADQAARIAMLLRPAPEAVA